jgi:CheY-like chemotaxis protein
LEKKLKILIAEDDADERDFIKQGFLQSTLFEIVDIVGNGNDLISTINNLDEKNLPDLILSDLNMPLFNGCEAMKEVKSNPKFNNIIYVIFSTSASPDTFDECSKSGAHTILLKPDSFFLYKDFAIDLYNKIISAFIVEK